MKKMIALVFLVVMLCYVFGGKDDTRSERFLAERTRSSECFAEWAECVNNGRGEVVCGNAYNGCKYVSVWGGRNKR